MSSSRAASDYGGNDTEATTLLQQSTVVLSSSSSRGVPTRRDGYQPPTVESARSSVESSFLEEFASSPRSSAESLQREMIQMEVMDGDVDGVGRRPGGRLRQEFTKRFSSISSSLSAMSLPRNPFRGMNLFGGVRFPRIHIPEVPCFSRLGGEAMVPIYRILAVLAALIVVYVLLATDTFSFSRPVAEYTGPFDPESVRRYAEQGIDRGKIRHWLEYVSSFDHMAGTEGDLVLAKYVQGQFASFGLRTERMEYDVYLNYPKPGGRRVWMEKPKWEAVLEEPNVDKKHENTAVFHGHSKSGKAKGPVVFANFGTREDFKMLETEGISVKGAIVLIREGGPQPDRGLKIKAAQDKGAVGALLFSDPAVSGWDGPEDAVQRGSVSLSNWVMGDVLTPGWASLSDAKRIPTSESAGLLKIPSLPLVRSTASPRTGSYRTNVV